MSTAVNAVLQVAALLLLLLVVSNALCWLAFRKWPSMLLSENERLNIDYLARFDGDIRGHVPDWFDIDADQWGKFADEINMMITRGGHVYAPFIEVRHPPRSGALFNFHEHGFRHVRDQGPWPSDRQFFNIYFFGGSTTVHVGPDWAAIPSRLQEELAAHGAFDKPVRVYNFGCGSFFSTQERILFEQLLLDGAVPDMAVFLDGVNDFYFFDGRPAIAGFFKHALDMHNRANDESRRNKTAADPKWALLGEFFWSLPSSRLLEVIGERRASKTAAAGEILYRPERVDPQTLVPAMDRYFGNKRQIESLCREYGVQPLFVVQPTPAYKYDLKYHITLNRHFGLGGHERSGTGYELMAERLAGLPSDPALLWLADIQEKEQQPLYLDNMHYTAGFGRTIARLIADRIASAAGHRQAASRTVGSSAAEANARKAEKP